MTKWNMAWTKFKEIPKKIRITDFFFFFFVIIAWTQDFPWILFGVLFLSGIFELIERMSDWKSVFVDVFYRKRFLDWLWNCHTSWIQWLTYGCSVRFFGKNSWFSIIISVNFIKIYRLKQALRLDDFDWKKIISTAPAYSNLKPMNWNREISAMVLQCQSLQSVFFFSNLFRVFTVKTGESGYLRPSISPMVALIASLHLRFGKNSSAK